MKNTDLETLKLVLQRNELDARTVAQIIADIQAENAADEDEEKEPPVKKQWVIIAQDPLGLLAGVELTGFSVQIPEDESVYTAVERIQRAGHEFNATRKGRRMPARALHEVIEFCPTKIFKESKVWPRHREPVFILTNTGELPREAPEVANRAARQIIADGFGVQS